MRTYYASFDAFPTSKGASTHILNSIQALSQISTKVDLFCLNSNEVIQLPENVTKHSFFFDDPEENYLTRANLFAEKVFQCMNLSQENAIGQFRDIWSGLGMINRPNLKTIFEVNALTSIELPVRYPLLTTSLIAEIEKIEKQCLVACDKIVTPSDITKNYLIKNFAISEDKISVIPNGSQIEITTKPKDSVPENYIIYFGALQPWQGLDILFKSLQYLKDFKDLKLLVCSSVKEKGAKPFLKLAETLGIKDQVIFKYELSKTDLHYYIQSAKASIAPLKYGDRNMVQGCCPIKILETMSCKIPIVASDLPVCRELVNDDEAYFFWPEDEQDLSRCIRFILENPEDAAQKSQKAFQKFTNQFTWNHHNEKLKHIYQSLI